MHYSFLVQILTISISCIANIASLELAPYPLPGRLYSSKEYVTLSGTDSGGYVAQLVHFAHSYYIKGCGVYSATFARCGPANGNEEDFRTWCLKNSALSPEEQYQVDSAVTEYESYNTNQLIDSLGLMRNSYLYVYCGLQNEELSAAQQLLVIALYERYLNSPYLIYARVQDTSERMRVIDTENYYDGPTCPRTHEADGTVSRNCTNMSAPAEALGFLLGKYLNYVNPFYPYRKYVSLGPLRSFDQTEFTTDLPNAGLDDVGYYYVPEYCETQSYGSGNGYAGKKRCLVHVYFHGCGQGREFLGTSHVKYSNYLEIAEANYIIMLFPQALSSEANPRGCWDYIGWSGPLYATKQGEQIQAIWRMLERLLYLPKEKLPYASATGRSGGGNGKSSNQEQRRGGGYYGGNGANSYRHYSYPYQKPLYKYY